MTTVSSLLGSTVQTHSDRVAVLEGDGRITYGTLGSMVESLSSYLLSVRIERGDRVVILLPNSVEFAVSFFAVVHIGAIAVPVNSSYKQDEIEFYISDTDATSVLTSHELQSLAQRAASGSRAHVRVIKGHRADWRFSQNASLSQGDSFPQPEDEAVYLHSTGSTGEPKRVGRTHRNLLALAENHTRTIGWTAEDVILFAIPISHTYGFGNFISAVKVGASMCMMGEFNRNKVVGSIERESVTVFPAVPFMLDVLAETYLPKPPDLSSLETVLSAGAPLTKETFYNFRQMSGISPRQLYGSTETGVISINLSDRIEERFDSVGRAVENVVVKIFREDGKEAETGELGEIAVKSPSMTTGYKNSPGQTDEVFRNDYYFTGDLGMIDGEGYIYIKGRKKLFINVGGYKVDPVEVESFLTNHPDIEEVAVLGLTDESGGEIVKAVVVTSRKMDVREIYEFCRGKISHFKIPRLVEFKNEIPKSATGKVMRGDLK